MTFPKLILGTAIVSVALAANGTDTASPEVQEAAKRLIESLSKPPEPSEKQVLEAAKKNISNKLRNPESAQFRDLRVYRGLTTIRVCGEVSGQNGFGGMAQPIPFFFLYSSDSSVIDHQSAFVGDGPAGDANRFLFENYCKE